MTTSKNTPTNYFGPFLTMVFLFLIVGFLTTANGQFQGPLKAAFLSEAGQLKNTLATLITFSWFLAYPLCGGLGSRWISRHGYKGTLIRGLVVMTAGLGLFFLSSWFTVQFPDVAMHIGGKRLPGGFFIFLLGSFVVGASATILQVVINPYLTACNVRGTQAVQRLAIGGTANSVGTTVAPYFVSGIVFGGVALEDVQIRQLMVPFLMLVAVVLLIIFVLLRLSLPDIEGTHSEAGEKLERSVWSFRHLTLGVVAIFFYVGCEVCIGTNINLYVMEDLGLSVSTVTLMATLYWGGLLAGRLLGSTLSAVHPRVQLTFTTVMASLLVVLAMITNNPWVLVAVGLFHSIMWGAIFTLSVAGLGKYTSAASGVFMIGVVGGALLPLLQGVLADWTGQWRWSWSLVLLGELVMLLYARFGSIPREPRPLSAGKTRQAAVLLLVLMTAVPAAAQPKEAPDNTTLSAILSRASVRRYQDTPLSSQQVELLLRAGMAAPSCVNRQPWELLVITDAEAKEKVVRGLGSNDFVHSAPLVIIPCVNMQQVFNGDTYNWMADLSAVSENILLAAHSMGLGGCWVGGWPNEGRVGGLRREFNLPDHIIPVSILPIGYPAEQPAPKDKWKPEKVHYNSY